LVPYSFFTAMAARFCLWKCVRSLAAAAIVFAGCGRSAPVPAGQTVDRALPPRPNPSALHENLDGSDAPMQTPQSRPEAIPPEQGQAQNQVRVVLTQYREADPETRTNIEENISELTDAGISNPQIATTLGTMFAMEDSADIKCSILNELYELNDPSALEYVLGGLSPNQPLEVRDEAISILKDINDKRAISSLWPLLADPDEVIREEAQEAIDQLGKPDAK
jgi:hypothetical protein